MLLCMSVNVRWNGRGWPGKVPRSPVASPEKAKAQGKLEWKTRPTERYRKKPYGKKREWQLKKKRGMIPVSAECGKDVDFVEARVPSE
jgi:hypothetical protein